MIVCFINPMSMRWTVKTGTGKVDPARKFKYTSTACEMKANLPLLNWKNLFKYKNIARAAVVHLNFRAGSTFPVPVFTVHRMDIGLIKQTISRCNKVDAVRLYASYKLNLLLLKGQRCVIVFNKNNFSFRILTHED